MCAFGAKPWTMIPEPQRFVVFAVASLLVFVGILRLVTRRCPTRPKSSLVWGVAAVVCVGRMLFARSGHNAGLPWWIYYTAPALVTLVLPPVVFRFSAGERWRYLALALLSSPAIHVASSLLLGWHEYMLFIAVPSLQDLLDSGAH